MKNFLLGVGATLAALALVLVVLVFSLGSGATSAAGSTASPRPTGVGHRRRAARPTSRRTRPGSARSTCAARTSSRPRATSSTSWPRARACGSRTKGLQAQTLDIDATIPFATVAEQVGQDVTVYDAGNGKTGVERQVTILGRDLTLKATGTVTADGGQLLIEPETVDLGGPSFLDAAASTLARSLATIRQDVPGVPTGMSLTAVEVTPQGFDAQLSGTDVVVGR